MGVMSVQSMGTGALNYSLYSSEDKNSSPEVVAEMPPVEVFTAPNPIDVIEPVQIENPFENPFDFSSVNNPFEIEMPVEIENPFSMSMPMELDMPSLVPEIGPEPLLDSDVSATPAGNGKDDIAMSLPGNRQDEESDKSGNVKKKVTWEELMDKYKCSTCESRKDKDLSSDLGVFSVSSEKTKGNTDFGKAEIHKEDTISPLKGKTKTASKKFGMHKVSKNRDDVKASEKESDVDETKNHKKDKDVSKAKNNYIPEKLFSFEI